MLKFHCFDYNGHHYSIYYESKNTRNGFKHIASISKDDGILITYTCHYINRTWERYTYESVLHKAINGTLGYYGKDFTHSKRGRKTYITPTSEQCEAILHNQPTDYVIPEGKE